MIIKITNCRNSRLWYSKHVEETFDVVRDEFDVYWVQELNEWRTLNFILKEDAEVVS